MTKKETIWRYVLTQALKHPADKYTQKAIAAHFGYSLNTVFNALKVPRQIGAVSVTGRDFSVRDPEKLLMLWATVRNLKRDVVYATHVDETVQRIEGSVPANVVYAAYSAYRVTHGEPPADYDKVFVYADSLAEIKKRFPPKKGYANLFVLKPDAMLPTSPGATTDAQTYVDIWNLDDWYARDFLQALKGKLKI